MAASEAMTRILDEHGINAVIQALTLLVEQRVEAEESNCPETAHLKAVRPLLWAIYRKTMPQKTDRR